MLEGASSLCCIVFHTFDGIQECYRFWQTVLLAGSFEVNTNLLVARMGVVSVMKGNKQGGQRAVV